MATRWDLIKATLADRKPVPTATIIEDIRAGAERTLQPAVQAGARFRKEHPQAAQKISIAVRAPPKKFIEVERKVAAKIPTLYQISLKGAEFRKSNPAAANKLYTTFQKAHVQTQKVGSITQRNALAGYVNGSYESLQRQPVKTAAMFAAGLGSGKALSVIGKVGKAYGAGTKTKRLAQAAQIGLTGMYGAQSINTVMSAPNSYEAGQRAAKIVYTELLPLAAGVGVAKGVPKAAAYTKQKVKFVSQKFKANTKNMLADDKAMAQMSFGKTKKQQLEAAIKLQKKLKKAELTPDEVKYLENKYGTKRLKTVEQKRKEASAAEKEKEATIRKQIKSGELVEVKSGTGAQQQIQLVKVVQKPKVKVKTKQDVAQRVKAEQKLKVLKEEQVYDSAQHVIQKQQAHFKKMEARVAAMPKFKSKATLKLESQLKNARAQKQKVVTIQKQKRSLKQRYIQKQITLQQYKQKLAQLNKQVSKLAIAQKQTLKQAQKAVSMLVLKHKQISKAVVSQKQKQKTKPVLIPRQKSKTTAVKKTKPIQKATTKQVPKRVTKKKVIAKTPKKPKIPVPPTVPKLKTPKKKKKIIKKKRKSKKSKQKNLNAVATFKDLLG